MRKTVTLSIISIILGVVIIVGYSSVKIAKGEGNTIFRKEYPTATVEYAIPVETNSLSFDFDSAKVEFSRNTTEMLEISYSINVTKNDPEPSFVNNKFTLHYEKNFWINFGLFDSNPRINVKLPLSYQQNLSIQISSGFTNFSNLGAINELIYKGISGGVSISDLAIKKMEVSNSSGLILLENIVSENEIYALNTSGYIKVVNCVAKSIQVNNTSGYIYVDKINATSIYLKNTSGAINGSIKGKSNEFSIEVSQTSGYTNIHTSINAQAPKSLKVLATTGSITLSFTE